MGPAIAESRKTDAESFCQRSDSFYAATGVLATATIAFAFP